jgi:hypothetical protein
MGFAEKCKEKTDANCREGITRYFKQGKKRYEPRGQRCADIGPKHDGDCLSQGQQTRIDKSDGHNRCCAGALNEHGDDRTYHQSDDWPLRQNIEGVFQPISGDLSQTIGHHPHTEKEETQSSNERENHFLRHDKPPNP